MPHEFTIHNYNVHVSGKATRAGASTNTTYWTGEIKCTSCSEIWQGKVPNDFNANELDTIDFQCPGCSAFTGKIKQ